MNHRNLKVLAALIVLLFTLTGCAMLATQSTTQYAYKTLSAAGIAYDNAMEAVADLDAQGRLPETTKQEILELAEVYYEAYHLCADAVIFYEQVGIRQPPASMEEKFEHFMLVYEQFMRLVMSTTAKYTSD